MHIVLSVSVVSFYIRIKKKLKWNERTQGLYGAGARKFSVVSPSLVGCCPTQRLIANRTKEMDQFRCLAPANNLSTALYPMINSMLQDLSAQLPGMNYSLADSIGMVETLLNSTQTPGENCNQLEPWNSLIRHKHIL
jgi:hypothetical protein